MALLFVALLLLLSMATHTSGASYCLCKDGLSDSVLQKNINYACGAGADCSAISQGGSCFNPNTVKDHCNFAVNSFYQKKGQATGSCDFSGTAYANSNPPAVSGGCSYPSSGSGGTPTTPGTGSPGMGSPGSSTPPGTGTPSTGTPGTGTPSTGTPGTGTPSTGTPGTGMPSTGSPGTSTGTGTPGTSTGTGSSTPGTSTGTPSTTVPGNNSPFLGLGPTGGVSNTNPDSSGVTSLHQCTAILYASTLTILFSGFLSCFKL